MQVKNATAKWYGTVCCLTAGNRKITVKIGMVLSVELWKNSSKIGMMLLSKMNLTWISLFT